MTSRALSQFNAHPYTAVARPNYIRGNPYVNRELVSAIVAVTSDYHFFYMYPNCHGHQTNLRVYETQHKGVKSSSAQNQGLEGLKLTVGSTFMVPASGHTATCLMVQRYQLNYHPGGNSHKNSASTIDCMEACSAWKWKGLYFCSKVSITTSIQDAGIRVGGHVSMYSTSFRWQKTLATNLAFALITSPNWLVFQPIINRDLITTVRLDIPR